MKKCLSSIKIMSLVAFALVLTFTVPVQAERMKMALGDATGSFQHETGKKFKELVEAKTGGKTTVELFPGGQLGSEQDTVNDTAMGILEFSVLPVNNLSPFSPTLGLLTLPYIIQSPEDAVTLTQGKVGKELIENTIRDAGVRIIAWGYTGFRVFTNSKRPVATLKDLKGLIVRVPKNEIMIQTYKSWGINPTPMAFSETFTALQQKVVDGQCNPYATISSMQFYEVQNNVTPLRYLFLLEPIIMSESIFQSKSPEMQKILLDAGMETTKYNEKFLAESEAAIIKDLTENKGMVITMPANDEKEWIEAATKAVWPKFYKSVGGKETVEKALSALGRRL